MNSKELSTIKNKLKPLLKDKRVLDVILFGSFARGKENPSDIDIAVISNEKIPIEIKNFHFSFLKPEDFFLKEIPSLIITLFKEGYSLKNEKHFSKIYSFEPMALFSYELKSLSPSKKVGAINFLRGRRNNKGLIEEVRGKWISKQVFLCPLEKSQLIEDFLTRNKIKFNKRIVLIH